LRLKRMYVVSVVLMAALIVGGSFVWLISREQEINLGLEGQEINLGLEDNGKTLDVSVGAVVTIKLPENPSTGYEWQCTVDENVVEVMEDSFIPATRNVIGAGGTRILKLNVIGSGEGKIIMDYMRAWEKNPPIERFSVTLRVK